MQQLAQFAQEVGGAVQTNGGLQIRALQRLAQHAAKLAVHANVHIGLDQTRDIGQVTSQRENHVHIGADALHQAADFCQVAGTVEGAVARADDVDAGLFAHRAVFKGFARRHFSQTIFAPQPIHGAVGALPLVFVDGARQKAGDVGAFRRDAAADHLGNRSGHHHGGQFGVECGVGALHGAFGAFAAQLLFSQTGHHNRQLVRRQCIGVMQHRSHRQVFAAHRAVDDHLQTLDGGEHIHRTPVTTCAVVVQDQGRLGLGLTAGWRIDLVHEPISSALRFFISFSI